MKSIMLILTESCNLACKYCYECSEGHKMTFATARKIIDSEMINAAGENFSIFFFGGEPLLNFDVLKQVYQYTEAYYSDRIEKYAITTNGTLVRDDIKTWLHEHREKFEITLSLDGTKEMHDRNRRSKRGKGSFDMVDLNFFAETWPGCVVKMTISPETLKDFAKGIIFIEKWRFRCKANFASGVDFNIKENKKILLKNMTELIEYYSNNNNALCYMLDLPLQAILVPLDEKFRYCGAGIERHCYGDGNDGWYPCQGLMPMSVEGRGRTFQYKTFSEKSIMEKSACKTCKFIRICRTCYAMNYNMTKNIYQPDEQICMLNQLCMIASARIQYNRLKIAGTMDRPLERAVYIIAKELNDIFG